MTTIATWNVNSVKARLDTVLAWLKEATPDIVCFQELKCEDAAFPREAIEALGYNVAVHGQKTYNGVAVLSRAPFDEVSVRLPGNDADEQARYLETVVVGVRVVSLYLPNGNPPLTEKYAYKLAWMDRLIARSRHLLRDEEPFILSGDYNVIPSSLDAKDPQAWRGDALFLPETRAKFRELLSLGLTEAFRTITDAQAFTFWDYQAGAWQKNNGIRIDHHLLSPQAADRLRGIRIDRHVRDWEKPSDHVPVVLEIA